MEEMQKISIEIEIEDSLLKRLLKIQGKGTTLNEDLIYIALERYANNMEFDKLLNDEVQSRKA